MQIYFFSSDPGMLSREEIERRLGRRIPRLQRIDNFDKLASADELISSREKAIVIVLSDRFAQTGFEEFINITERHRNNVFFILLSSAISASDYKRLIQRGGADWVSSSGSLDEVFDIIDRQSRIVEPAQPRTPQKNRLVVSFVPVAGGVGNTTVSLESALELKQRKAFRSIKCCYVDLNFQTSHAADYIDLEARLKIVELIDRPERMDDQLLSLFVSHHSSGLDVFAAPPSKLDPCEVSIQALDALLDRVVSQYEAVFIDLPVWWFRWTAPTIENSDVLLLTTINTIPSLRQLRTNIDAVLKLKKADARIAVVVNRVEAGLVGGVKRRGHVERVVGDLQTFYVHEDTKAVDRVNRGAAAALGGPSRMRKDIRPIAEFCSAQFARAASR